MNMHYPIPERTYHSMHWLIVVALLVAGLLLAVRTAGQPVQVNLDHPTARSENQAIPQAVPVPEPPQSQPASYPDAGATPIPAAAQPLPVAQPVPTPPTGP